MFNIFDQNLMIQRMREELTEHGFRELRTAAEVDAALGEAAGSTLLMINSVCGCAAGAARHAFDGARPLGVSEDGVKQYRSHWPQTMAAKPE
ncbi:MAG: BrxA/BrxB family bacilliredoxin, partial [Armatimonadetes bacterium]|nr:BrxA/BrxB family bacilliredoxin [Armatimonadota bacterium]